ncbi:MAG: GWxTD domain-containing protein, partial [Candidatus Aminicenantaceae bacterium]
EEEVVYIITPTEKEVFLQLQTDREREMFFEAFWKQRDPNPNIPENEFKDEHYRRISHANKRFGRESPGPGWRTARGKIYITLGEPNTIERFEHDSEIYPTIIWFYSGMGEYGLPNAFNVVFFKRSGIGEYELYSPIKFGPQRLLIHFKGDPMDYMSAYRDLMGIEPSVAYISLTLLPSEAQHLPSPSIASELLISQMIPSAPHEKVKDAYAKKLLKYKDFIEVDYSANYIDNDALVRVIQDKSGMFFVHYLIEPSKFSIERVEDQYYCNFEVNGKVSDLEGKTVYQYDRRVPIKLNQNQLDNIRAKLFSFQDLFPLVEGNYKFDVLMRNTISKEFTSFEVSFTIPEASSLILSDLTLANRIVEDSKYKGKNKPLLIGGTQLVPSPRNDFSKNETLYLFFQIFGLTEELSVQGTLEYSLFNEEEKIHSFSKKIADYPDKTYFLEEFPLANYSPAYYKIRVALLDDSNKEILFSQRDFYISLQPTVPRPWVLSFPMPPSDDPLYANILGLQYENKGELQKAHSLLEEAFRKQPKSAKYGLDFARLLSAEKEFQRVKEIALPFLKEQEKYEFLSVLGQSCQALGEYAEAIAYYKDYLTRFGTFIQILNSIGECYYRLGNIEEALIAWEKSLEINPDQEDLKKTVESIKR